MGNNKTIKNLSSKKVVTSNMVIADSYYKRFFGLMGKKSIKEDYCLLLKPCNQIHMFFMKFSIDVVYLDKSFKVCDIDYDLKPWKVGKRRPEAIAVLEFRAGYLEDKISINDFISIDLNNGPWDLPL